VSKAKNSSVGVSEILGWEKTICGLGIHCKVVAFPLSELGCWWRLSE